MPLCEPKMGVTLTPGLCEPETRTPKNAGVKGIYAYPHPASPRGEESFSSVTAGDRHWLSRRMMVPRCRPIWGSRSPWTGDGDGPTRNALPMLYPGRKTDAKIIPAELPDFLRPGMPYELYIGPDIAHRVAMWRLRAVSVHLRFCLSSLVHSGAVVPLDRLLGEMQKLLERGLKQFKFVDRTFNLNLATSKASWNFFSRAISRKFLHYEMIPTGCRRAARGDAQFPTRRCNLNWVQTLIPSGQLITGGRTTNGWRKF